MNQPSMEGMHAVAEIGATLHDLNMAELWKKLESLIPQGDILFHDPVPFKSARRTTLSSLYKFKYHEAINERMARAVVKWAQGRGELLITSSAGVRYATSKDEYHDWARTQLRHAFSILRFWRIVAPGIVQELEGQLDTIKTQEDTHEDQAS